MLDQQLRQSIVTTATAPCWQFFILFFSSRYSTICFLTTLSIIWAMGAVKARGQQLLGVTLDSFQCLGEIWVYLRTSGEIHFSRHSEAIFSIAWATTQHLYSRAIGGRPLANKQGIKSKSESCLNYPIFWIVLTDTILRH